MKKFLVTLFIILALAGTAFFFGWAQTGVPPDSVGVVRSKTHGIDPRLVIPGEFRWMWYKLIPTNAKTIAFRLNTVHHTFSAKNNLPSGQVYSAFSGIDGNFSWEINAVLSFSLRPESLIPLVTVQNIGTQEELAAIQRDIAAQIETFIMRRLDLSVEYEAQIEALLNNRESPELNNEILRNFPSIDRFSLRVRSANLPDFNLYRQVKSLYDDFIDSQKEFISGSLEEKARNRIEFLIRFGELEQYGALFTKYPVLLEYLALGGREQDR